MRYIRLNETNKIIAIRYGESIVDGEVQSETGDLGQLRQQDGSFINDPTPIPPQPPSDIDLLKADLAEQKLQTQLLDLKLNIVSESMVI